MSRRWLWAQCRADAIAHHKFGNQYRFSDVNLVELGAQTAVAAVQVRDEMVPLTPLQPAAEAHVPMRVSMVLPGEMDVVPDHTLENLREVDGLGEHSNPDTMTI